MKYKVLIFLLLMITVSCKTKSNISGDEIWDNYQKTVASKEIIKSIKTSYKLSETILKQGVVKSEIFIKYPNKIINKEQYGNKFKVTFILNGEKGIVNEANKIRKMNNDELIMYKDLALIFPEIYYSTKTGEIKYIGEVNDNGKSYYKIRIDKLANDKEKYYYLIDKKTFELHKMLIGENGVYEILKRKKFSGVNMIVKTRTVTNNDTILWTVKENRFNIELNDSIFKIN